MNFTQIEPEHSYEIPSRSIDSGYGRDSVRVEPADVAIVLVSLVITLALWGWIMWRLASKAGYRGAARWIWFVFLGFPLTSGWGLVAFVLLPWPVQKKLKQQAGISSPKSDIDQELDQMRKRMQG